MALLSRFSVIIWEKCHDRLKNRDSPEHEQMWIHKRKHSFPCPILPWQEQAEAICRAGGSGSTTDLNSYLGVTNLLEKKGIPKWLALCNLWIALLWLKCRNGSEGVHRRSYVTRQSLDLLRAHLFSASTNVTLWHGRGALLLRKKDTVRLDWWHMPQECYPSEGKYICRWKKQFWHLTGCLTAFEISSQASV